MTRLSIRITDDDNVAVALRDIVAGTVIDGVTVRGDVSAGHKIALSRILAGAPVIKFGYPIGVATSAIGAGEHVHSHNLKSTLKDDLDADEPELADGSPAPLEPERPATFDGYRRADGRVGIRNEIWIINTVGCVNNAAERIATLATSELVRPGRASTASTRSNTSSAARSSGTTSRRRRRSWPAWCATRMRLRF